MHSQTTNCYSDTIGWLSTRLSTLKIKLTYSQPAPNADFPILSKRQLYPFPGAGRKTSGHQCVSKSDSFVKTPTSLHRPPPLWSWLPHHLSGLLQKPANWPPVSLFPLNTGVRSDLLQAAQVMLFLCSGACRVYTFWPPSY